MTNSRRNDARAKSTRTTSALASAKTSSSKTSVPKRSVLDMARPSSATKLKQMVAAWFGMMLVWSFMVPADATSVFLGEALTQNLAWLALGTAAAVAAAISNRGGIRLHKYEWIVIALSLIWLIVSAIFAGQANDARVGWNGFWQVIALGSCYTIARFLIQGQQSATAIGLAVVAGCVATSAHGLEQVFWSFPNDRAIYEADPDRLLNSLGIAAPPGSPQRQQFENRLYSPEPFATYALANSLAVPLTAGLVILIGLAGKLVMATTSRSPDAKSTRSFTPQFFAIGLSLLLVGSCWILTRSRVAYIGLLVAGIYGFTLYLYSRSSPGENRSPALRVARKLVIPANVIGAALLLGFFWLLSNDQLVLTEAPKSIAFRIEYWRATASMLVDHGLFGVGLGNFQSYYPQYKLAQASEIIADPHNWPLDVAITLSIPLAVVITCWLARHLLGSSSERPYKDELTNTPENDQHTNADHEIATYILLGAGLGGIVVGLLLVALVGQAPLVLFGTWGLAFTLLFPLMRILDASTIRITRAAVVSMLVCLLASGSWQASGIAIPLLALLAASSFATSNPASNMQTDSKDHTGGNPQPDRLNRFRYTPIIFPAFGFVIFSIQSWQPVNNCWAALQQFQQAAMLGQPFARQLALVQDAAAADPLNSEPLRILAQLQFQRVLASGSQLSERMADEAEADQINWLESNPTSYLNWREAGNRALELAAVDSSLVEKTKRQTRLEQAVGYYKRAIELFPSSVALHAQLAVTLAALGNDDQISREVAEVLRLDNLIPHEDKKLAAQLVWLPPTLAIPGREIPLNSIERPQPSSNWCRAEPIIEALKR